MYNLDSDLRCCPSTWKWWAYSLPFHPTPRSARTDWRRIRTSWLLHYRPHSNQQLKSTARYHSMFPTVLFLIGWTQIGMSGRPALPILQQWVEVVLLSFDWF